MSMKADISLSTLQIYKTLPVGLDLVCYTYMDRLSVDDIMYDHSSISLQSYKVVFIIDYLTAIYNFTHEAEHLR